MGTCYTYLLHDEMDWYGFNREEVIKRIKQDLPVAEVLGHWYGYIVIDLNKNSPWGKNAKKLWKWCDVLFYYSDLEPWRIKRADFKTVPNNVSGPVVQETKPYKQSNDYNEKEAQAMLEAARKRVEISLAQTETEAEELIRT